MAEFRCIASGSQGNSYIIKCEKETLVIELGVSWSNIIKALDYDVRNVVAAIVSHGHSDHAKRDTVNNMLGYGIPIYSCVEVAMTYKGVHTLKKNQKTLIGGFKIQPIPLQHSVECFGFIVEHEEFGKLVFATDCSEFCYRIKNVNHWFIECNWSEDILVDNLCDNSEMRSRHEHHLELNDTILALKENFSPLLNTIVLLHLSNGNSNSEMFKKRVSEELGFFNIYIAEKGLSLHLEKEEF